MTVCNCLVSVAVISSFSLDWGCETTSDSKWWLDIVSWRKSVAPVKWKLLRKKRAVFIKLGACYCINKQTVSHQSRWIESHFKAKPRCRKLSLCLPNTLTCVCFILAPRLDVISMPTAPHHTADEIKPLTKMCFALSTCLISPALSCFDLVSYFTFKLSLRFSAKLDRKKTIKNVVILIKVCMYDFCLDIYYSTYSVQFKILPLGGI